MRRLLLVCLFFVICSKVLSSESESILRPAHSQYKLREEESPAALDLISKTEEKYHQGKTEERDCQNNQGEVQKVHHLNSANRGKAVYGGGNLNKPRKKTHSGAPSNVLHASFLPAAVGPVVIGLFNVILFF
ncbi:uncharacterized protein LOC115744482 [Rhodamnia argentea]|uniref:Uncharacterized protein LOC115744482 n=1 Tax=Rhodamnia argentea TaxID=178133 RepID=A0A8B8PLF3_9MYRT|nr:uncharacterized protein LOC115744482 [Rhodamnia argentea]